MESSKKDNTESDSNCFINFFKNIFQDKIKLAIFISIILVIIIIIIVVAVVVIKKKKNDDYYLIENDNTEEQNSSMKDDDNDNNNDDDNDNNNCGVSEEVYQKALKELEKHNEYRKQHQVGELTINCDLMKIAQKYSKKLHDNNKFEHSHDKYDGKNMGENFYKQTTSNKYDPPIATILWYNEIKDYNFNTGKSRNSNHVGHFTQVVWKGTEELGVGFTCGDNGCFVVANYYPAGNYVGQFTENVLQKSR